MGCLQVKEFWGNVGTGGRFCGDKYQETQWRHSMKRIKFSGVCMQDNVSLMVSGLSSVHIPYLNWVKFLFLIFSLMCWLRVQLSCFALFVKCILCFPTLACYHCELNKLVNQKKRRCELNKSWAHVMEVISILYVLSLADPLGITMYFLLEVFALILGNAKCTPPLENFSPLIFLD